MGSGARKVMFKFHKRSLWIASGCLVPFLNLFAPSFLSLSGVGPSWAVLWLLPGGLIYGSTSGVVAGICLGLSLDGISLGGASHIPALVGLGYWWGRLGRRGRPIEQSFILGLLALIGTFFLGFSLWAQTLFLQYLEIGLVINYWGLHTLLAQAIITGLLAPMICSWLLLLWRRRFSL